MKLEVELQHGNIRRGAYQVDLERRDSELSRRRQPVGQQAVAQQRAGVDPRGE